MTRPNAARVPAPLLAIIAIFSVQFGNATAAALFESIAPLGATFLRLAFSAVLLLLIFQPRVRAWDARTWVGAAALGTGLAGMNALIYLAMSEIPLGVAVTIELLGPLAVAALGTRRPIDILWVLLALAGVVLLGFDPSATLSVLGIMFAAGAGVCWALYILASARLGPRVRGVDGLVMAMAIGAVLSAPLGASAAASAVLAQPWLLAAFAGVAVVTSMIPYALEFVALKTMASRVFGVLSSLGPAVAALAGVIVLQQLLSVTQLVALVLVVCASSGVIATARR